MLVNIKGRFILSYNDCLEIREHYKDFKIIEVKRINNMAQRYEAGSEFCELIIMNFEPEKVIWQRCKINEKTQKKLYNKIKRTRANANIII